LKTLRKNSGFSTELDGTPTESFGAEQNKNIGGRGKKHTRMLYIYNTTDRYSQKIKGL